MLRGGRNGLVCVWLLQMLSQKTRTADALVVRRGSEIAVLP